MASTTLGHYLGELRSAHGYGLRVASECIGIRPSELHAYEMDRRLPSLEVLKQFANCYGVSADSLVTLAVELPSHNDNTIHMTVKGAANMHPDTLAALAELGRAAYRQLKREGKP